MKKSQCEVLLKYLITRGSMGATALDIIRDCHIVNTTARISDLRKLGHIIPHDYNYFTKHHTHYYKGTHQKDGSIKYLNSEHIWNPPHVIFKSRIPNLL